MCGKQLAGDVARFLHSMKKSQAYTLTLRQICRIVRDSSHLLANVGEQTIRREVSHMVSFLGWERTINPQCKSGYIYIIPAHETEYQRGRRNEREQLVAQLAEKGIDVKKLLAA